MLRLRYQIGCAFNSLICVRANQRGIHIRSLYFHSYSPAVSRLGFWLDRFRAPSGISLASLCQSFAFKPAPNSHFLTFCDCCIAYGALSTPYFVCKLNNLDSTVKCFVFIDFLHERASATFVREATYFELLPVCVSLTLWLFLRWHPI